MKALEMTAAEGGVIHCRELPFSPEADYFLLDVHRNPGDAVVLVRMERLARIVSSSAGIRVTDVTGVCRYVTARGGLVLMQRGCRPEEFLEFVPAHAREGDTNTDR